MPGGVKEVSGPLAAVRLAGLGTRVRGSRRATGRLSFSQPSLTPTNREVGRGGFVFREGDKVSYPHHGAAIVVERADRMVFGERRAYLTLRLRHGDLTLMVPVDRTGQVGLRPVATKRQIDEVLHLLRTAAGSMPTLWHLRHRANLAKVTSGDILQVAEVVRDLDGMSRRTGLSYGERRMLFKARELLVSELAVAWDCTDEHAEATLDEVLEPPP